MDLTTLSSDDTPDRVRRLCTKARQPLRPELIESLGLSALKPRVGAVCVYHAYVETAVDALKKTGIPVAAVSTGFPHGLNSMPRRIEEIKDSVAAGAEEIDIVITRAHVFSGNWKALFAEISAFRKACGDAHLKTILGTGELGTFRNVAKASLVCMMAGADFIKTSTGKESVNATLPVSLVMLRMIREYFENTGFYVGFKPAGGIRTAKQSLDWMVMMKEELGREWLEPDLFRFGASGLLTDIERQLEHIVTGRYSAAHRQPTA
jgi:deoxyribose-phosphate aldolase